MHKWVQSLGVTGTSFVAGDVVAERFSILRKLNEGGMGVVYLAVQNGLDRPVALKVLHPSYADDAVVVKRFEKEANAISSLTNPHVVTLYDFGKTSTGALFLAMEYLEGESLREQLDGGSVFAEARAQHVVEQILEALVAAHQARIVHRDLKPENIMLIHRSRDVDFVKVLDFGLARSLDDGNERMTRHDTVVGTPTYMAPERVDGIHDDPRSDLYSLGALWFELVTGQPPFVGDNSLQVVLQHVREEPISPREKVPSLQEQTASVILRLLAKRPDERPSSALELLNELRGVVRRDKDQAEEPIALVRRKTQPPMPAPPRTASSSKSPSIASATRDITVESAVHLLTRSKMSGEQSTREMLLETVQQIREASSAPHALRACVHGLSGFFDRAFLAEINDEGARVLASVRVPDVGHLAIALQTHPAFVACKNAPVAVYDAGRTAPSWLEFYKAIGGQLPGGVLLGAHPTSRGSLVVYADHRHVDVDAGIRAADVAALAEEMAAALQNR